MPERTLADTSLALLLASIVAVPVTACRSEHPEARGTAAASAQAAPAGPKPQFVHRSRDGLPLEQFVQRELERGEAEGARVLVYVGAKWCEPCRHFHEAIESGELDTDLAGLRFLEFDLDEDAAVLSAAGYRSKYIPLLAIPDPDGRASGRMMEGSVKGPGAVRQNLLPRLRELLAAR